MNRKIIGLYKNLKREHGHPRGQWSIWARRSKTRREREQIIIESILTQRTNWKNVQLAMENLRRAKADSLRGIYSLKSTRKLAPLIRPSGFYRNKAEYLFGVVKFFVEGGGIKKISKIPISDLRLALCSIKGVGPETADSILLYALDKPVFVIDEYTKRILIAKRISQSVKYEELRKLFEDNLPRDFRLYQDFHALIVIHAKNKR